MFVTVSRPVVSVVLCFWWLLRTIILVTRSIGATVMGICYHVGFQEDTRHQGVHGLTDH
jgi:hypothetical protein